jgi:glycine/D-amino acid oxidase-like deaminating enzyme
MQLVKIGVGMRVVVIGCGAMGAPTAQMLAERGHDVTVLDRFGVPNLKGGSGFGLRSFRLSHHAREDVRLALRSLELYLDLQRRTGIEVYRRLGILHLGAVVDPMSAAFAAEGIPHRHLGAADVATIFPELRPRYGEAAMFQPDGGVNLCVPFLQACLKLAVARGAQVSPKERAVTLAPHANGVRVFTDRRRIDADVAVVTAGPWANELLAPIGMALPLQPGIVQVSYFRGAFGDDTTRPSLMERTRGPEEAMYGLIGPGQGYKMGFAVIDRTKFFQDLTARPLDPAQERRLAERVREDFPGFHTGPFQTECGVITLTPDDHFIIDRKGPIVVGAGCMGHAFKFAPALGSYLADLAEDRSLPGEMHRFRLDRPGLAGTLSRHAKVPVASS